MRLTALFPILFCGSVAGCGDTPDIDDASADDDATPSMPSDGLMRAGSTDVVDVRVRYARFSQGNGGCEIDVVVTNESDIPLGIMVVSAFIADANGSVMAVETERFAKPGYRFGDAAQAGGATNAVAPGESVEKTYRYREFSCERIAKITVDTSGGCDYDASSGNGRYCAPTTYAVESVDGVAVAVR